jgi:hypothetical protein
VHVEAAESAEDGRDMTVGERADNLQGLVAGDQVLAFEDEAESIDLGRGPVGKISEGLLADFRAFADGLAEEDSGRGVAIGDGFDVHGQC